MSDSMIAACIFLDKILLLFPSGMCLYAPHFALRLKTFRAVDTKGL